MFDSNWDLINGEDAHGIEVLNQSSVINLIESLVRYLQHHDPDPGVACSLCPDQSILKELHRTGTFLLLRVPGEYRMDFNVQVRRRDGGIYVPPDHGRLRDLMQEFDGEMQVRWKAASPAQIAAFALWKINWIHPFKNGNGRTARAFAYTCVCLKHGEMLPGKVTMIDLITQTRDEYEVALAHADESYHSTGTVDLGPLEAYVDGLLRTQLLSALGEQQPASG